MAATFPDALASRLRGLCVAHLREPSSYATDDATGAPILDFEPPLTAEEQATYDGLLRAARSAVAITPAERAALEPFLDTMRAFQQMSQAEFVNLTEAQTRRLTFDVLTALIRFDRAVLRD